MIRAYIVHPDGKVECDVAHHVAPPAAATLWIDLEAPTLAEIALLSSRWEFHPLAIEDCTHPQSRPKFERYPTHGFLVLAALNRTTLDVPCDTVGICVFVRPELVVSVHRDPLAAVNVVRASLAAYPDRVGRTPERVLHALADATIDELTQLLYHFEARVDVLEVAASRPRGGAGLVEPLIRVRRNLLALRRIVLPTREVIRRFIDVDNPEISADGRMYFRDVLDHVEVLSDTSALLLEVCNGALQIHANAANERLNQVMKYMAIVSTLMLPMTVIGGAFGMNFKTIPLSDHPQGFVIALALMLACASLLLAIFRARRWF